MDTLSLAVKFDTNETCGVHVVDLSIFGTYDASVGTKYE